MAESIIQPDTEQMETPEGNVPAPSVQETIVREPVKEAPVERVTPPSEQVPAQVIWTPRFIIIFVLTLVLGLSAESVLVQARDNGYLAENGILLVHVVPIFFCWIAIIVRARSPWTRLGGIFGGIWAIFFGIFLIITLHRISPFSQVLLLLNTGYSIALFGGYICLSVDRTAVHRWDTWFFSIAPVFAAGFVIALFLLTAPDGRSLITVETAIIAIANILSLLVWWLRPSCWKAHPGTTFLFGTAALILLLLAIPHLNDNDTSFYLRQIMLLCILLGTMRVLQGELRRRQLNASANGQALS